MLDEFVVVVFVPGPDECEGEVEVELEVDDEELVELEEEVDELEELVVVLVELEALEELVAGAHDIVSVATTPLIGRFSEETGVVGGTSTLNVSVTPPTSVTVTVHGSADALGMAASPRTTKMATASDRTARSRRLIVKLVRPLLAPSTCASHALICSTSLCCRGHGTAWYGALQFRTGGVHAAVMRRHARAYAGREAAATRPRRPRAGPGGGPGRRLSGAVRAVIRHAKRQVEGEMSGFGHQRAATSR